MLRIPALAKIVQTFTFLHFDNIEIRGHTCQSTSFNVHYYDAIDYINCVSELELSGTVVF